MDRTYPCGGYDVGSIPTGSTIDTKTCLKAGFVLWCSRAPYLSTVCVGIEKVEYIFKRLAVKKYETYTVLVEKDSYRRIRLVTTKT
jgi:hypothetical protein